MFLAPLHNQYISFPFLFSQTRFQGPWDWWRKETLGTWLLISLRRSFTLVLIGAGRAVLASKIWPEFSLTKWTSSSLNRRMADASFYEPHTKDVCLVLPWLCLSLEKNNHRWKQRCKRGKTFSQLHCMWVCFVSLRYERTHRDSDTPLILQLMIYQHGTEKTQFVIIR